MLISYNYSVCIHKPYELKRDDMRDASPFEAELSRIARESASFW